jgi:anti-sigma regulatory factor (Ser/Thr protein kinase)
MTAATSLEHDAMLFDGGDDLVSSLAPWLAAGLDRAEEAVVAMTAAHNERLIDALGPRAREVRFIPNDEWYVRPAATIAGWERLARDARARGMSALRIVGEVRFGDDRRRNVSWTRYESALNAALAGTPAWIVCPYDVARLPPSVVEDAWRTHPAVWTGGVRRSSGRFLEPAAMFAAVPEVEPTRVAAPLVDLTDVGDLGTARSAVRQAAGRLGIPRAVIDDLVLAMSEIATNAVRYGRGLRRLRLWTAGDELVCEIRDRDGTLADPLAGLIPPDGSASGGMGLWVARQLTEWLVIERPAGAGGSVVRFGLPCRRRAS